MGTAPKPNKDSLVLCEKKQTSLSVGKLSGFVDDMRSRKNGRGKTEGECRNCDYSKAIWKQGRQTMLLFHHTKQMLVEVFVMNLKTMTSGMRVIFLHNSFIFLCSLLLVVRYYPFCAELNLIVPVHSIIKMKTGWLAVMARD